MSNLSRLSVNITPATQEALEDDLAKRERVTVTGALRRLVGVLVYRRVEQIVPTDLRPGQT